MSQNPENANTTHCGIVKGFRVYMLAFLSPWLSFFLCTKMEEDKSGVKLKFWQNGSKNCITVSLAHH